MTVQRIPITSRKQWLAERSTRLGASETPAVAGLDPYKTALDVHLEKIGRKIVGESPIMRRGRLFEPAVLAYLQDELPDWRFEKPGYLLVDDEHRISCTPDLIATEPDQPGILNVQCKVVARSVFEGWPDSGEAPAGYQLQTAQESMLLGARGGILAALVVDSHGAELELFTVPRHAAAEAKILDIAAEFWRRIEAGVLPPIDYSRDGEAVKELFRPDPSIPAPVDLTGDNRLIELAERYEQVSHDIGLGEADKDAIKTEITAKLGGATSAICGGWKITNKLTNRKEFVVPAASFPRLLVSRIKGAAL